MLSVLIPLNNWDPSGLLEALSVQLESCGYPYEILVSDDSLNPDRVLFERLLSRLPGLSYYSRHQPLGRSKNRNYLASLAKYEYLLFIDGDAGLKSDRFIVRYLEEARPDVVLCGGTLYTALPPDEPEFKLRWKYGRTREETAATQRRLIPWKSFSTFNFLIPAPVFKNVGFDESIAGYGHEDTLFGIQLHAMGIQIKHLDNGLLHLGLEPADSFLAKIRESAKNLRMLEKKNKIPEGYRNGISLLKHWSRLRKVRLEGIIRFLFIRFERKLAKQLSGKQPSMLLLDLYKLGAISRIN